MDSSSKASDDKRGAARHDCREKIYFDFVYDFQAKVDFKPVSSPASGSTRKYSGFTRNISTQGICFSSQVQLNEGVVVDMDVYIKDAPDPVHLQGKVRWNKLTLIDNMGTKHFDTGIHLDSINGQPVKDSIHFDEAYKVYWSDVLESLLGQFRKEAKKRAPNGSK